MSGDTRDGRFGNVPRWWWLSGFIIILSSVQVAGAWGGITLLEMSPSYLGAATENGENASILLLIGLIVTVGWVGQGARIVSRGGDRWSSLLGLLTGGTVAILGGWNISIALGSGSMVFLIEGIVSTLIGVFGTAGIVAFRELTANGKRLEESNDRNAEQSQNAEIGESFDSHALDVLEPIAPDAIARAQDGPITNQRRSETKAAVQQTVIAAIDAGEFAPDIESRYGDRYDIVNLPTRFREVRLPPSGDPVHIRNVESTMRDMIANSDPGLSEVASVIDAVNRHYEEMSAYIGEREHDFDDGKHTLNATIANIETLVDRLDGEVGARTREYIIEGRHPTLRGVPGIKNSLLEAQRQLHRCNFDSALDTVDEIGRDAESLLTAVEFLVGVAGMEDTQANGATIPNEPAGQLLEELRPALENSFNREVTIDGDQVSFAARTAIESSDRENENGTADQETHSGSGRRSVGSHDVQRTDPGSKADEILYILRELGEELDNANGRIEFQTTDLPEDIASPTVLVELSAFCRRQTDIVDSVMLQKGSPPGFLEIEFTDHGSKNPISTLKERFVNQHVGK